MLKIIQLFVVAVGIASLGAIGGADPPQTQPAHKESEDRTVDGEGSPPILREVTFDGVGFSDVIDFMRDVSGANIVVDGKRLDDAEIDRNAPVTMTIRNVKFGPALGAVCNAAGKDKLVYGIHQGIIIVSTKEGLDLLSAALDRDVVAGDEKTKKALSQRIRVVSLDGVPISDAVDFVRNAGHVKIEVDWESLKKSSGLEKSSPVSLKLKFATVGDVMHLIFQTAADGPIQITNSQGVLKIGPPPDSKKPVVDEKHSDNKPGK